MKKISAVLTCILVMLSAFIPLCYAEETTGTYSYNYYTEALTDMTITLADGEEKIESINILYVLTAGQPITDTQIKISASKTSAPDNLVDMTDEFELGEVIWCKVVTQVDTALSADSYYDYDPADTTATEFYLICTEQDIIDEVSTYRAVIKDLKPTEDIQFNYVSNDRIMINGNAIDQIEGSTIQNDNSNLFISFLTTASGPVVKEPVTEATEPETISETVSDTTEAVAEAVTQEQKCSLCGICPFQPQGVCLFVWIGIIVVGVVVILVLVKSLIKKNDEY